MIKNSIAAKLWLTIIGIVVIVLTLLSILIQQFFYNNEIEQQSEELTRLAQTVSMMISETKPNEYNHMIQQITNNIQNVNITYSIPFSKNKILNDRFQTFSPVAKEYFLSGKPISIQQVVNGVNSLSIYQILKNPHGSPGMVEIFQKMSVLNAPLTNMRNLILFDMGLGVLLATGLAFVVSKNLSRPLIQMNAAAEEMVHGNFERKVSVTTGDEVGRLGNTFNALTDELADTIQQLSLQRDQLSSILSSLEDGVVAADLEGKITLANPPALRRLRIMSLSESGLPETSILPEYMSHLLTNVRNFKESIFREMVWQGRHIQISMIPLYESDGETIRGVVSVLRDVTEERRLDRLRKDFIANVSHELRTPLSMMQGYTEALLDEFGLEDPVHRHELTEIIHDETLRMKRLVNDLLDLAQLESGQFQMKFAIVNVVLLMKRVARKFHALAQDRNIHFKVSLPNNSISIMADEDRMEQVFTNLLDNAFQHTHEGIVSLKASIQAHHVQFQVTDTGSGIPEEDVPFIFERFYKADKARTRKSSGTGLGLAITRHIVVEHGGDIIVESQVGKGTLFTVIIPLKSADS